MSTSNDSILFDIFAEDIVIPLSLFQQLRESDPILGLHIVKERGLMSCEALEHSPVFILINELPVKIKEHPGTPFGPGMTGIFREMGICVTNLRVLRFSNQPIVGRSVLDDFDLVLDSAQGRVSFVPRGVKVPSRKLNRYRLDPGSITAGVTGWYWVPATGRLTNGDFVFTEFLGDIVEMICLRGYCQNISPRGTHRAVVGEVEMEMLPKLVRVSQSSSWFMSAFKVNQEGARVQLYVEERGYRYKRNDAGSVPGKRLEFVPVTGPRTAGEFGLPEWNLKPHQESIKIVGFGTSEDPVQLVMPMINTWFGAPLITVTDDKRIVVSVDPRKPRTHRRVKLYFLGVDDWSLKWEPFA